MPGFGIQDSAKHPALVILSEAKNLGSSEAYQLLRFFASLRMTAP